MHAGLDFWSAGVRGPGEEGTEGEVLDDGKFGKDFHIVHFDHALHYVSVLLHWNDWMLQ